MEDKLPILQSQRIYLREIDVKDAYNMYEYASLPNVGPHAGWQPHQSVGYTKMVIKAFNAAKSPNNLGVFAIILKSENKMIGTVELHSCVNHYKAELGYTVNPSYWGNGYVVEASRLVLQWGFETLKLQRIEATAFTDNYQSKRVCEKLGFTYEGIKKKGFKLYNGYVGDIYCYGLTDDEYYELKTRS